MDIVIFGDTHELHWEVDMPFGDVLIFTGDLSMFGKSWSAIRDFNSWLGNQPHQHKIVVPGNHEFFLEADPTSKNVISNAVVLINESITINGLHIYGSPVTPLNGGAYGMADAKDRKQHWAQVPDDTNVLITHGPPLGILDRSPGQSEHAGDRELRDRIADLRFLRLHAFGHIHGAHGMQVMDNVTFVNGALMGELGDIVHTPHLLRINRL